MGFSEKMYPGTSGNVLLTESASQAILAVAVESLEMQERLRIGGAGNRQTYLLPRATDVVFFGREHFEQVDDALTDILAVVHSAVCEENGNNCVDKQPVHTTFAQLLGFGSWFQGGSTRMWLTKTIMCLPIFRYPYLKHISQGSKVGLLDDTTEIQAVSMIKPD